MNKKKYEIIVSIIILLSVGIVITLFLKLRSEKNSSAIYNEAIKSVVELKASTDDIGESYGSAVIFDNGKAITNAHVVSYSNLGVNTLFESIKIRFSYMELYLDASLIKIDYEVDLAIIEFDDNEVDYKAISFSKKEYNSGDSVYAIGNSSNYGIGISDGIISVREVAIKQDDLLRNVIQCDINISSGNSGGALLDKSGKLIGITTFRTRDLKGNINYGFAYSIPLKTVLNFIN